MRSIVAGASAGVGRALAEELASLGHDLLLLSSDQRDLDAISADLSLRFGVSCSTLAVNLGVTHPEVVQAFSKAKLGRIDNFFYVAGQSLEGSDPGGLSDEDVATLIDVNYSAAVGLINRFLPELLESEAGNCVGLGSVAAARARRHNTVYASSKSALEFYFRGLRHHLHGTRCRIQFYRLGYTDTQMTFGQRSLIPKATPRAVARTICRGLGRDRGVRTVPFWWRVLTILYSAVPWPL